MAARLVVPSFFVTVMALCLALAVPPSPVVAQELGAAFKASYAAEAANNLDEALRVMNDAIGTARTSYPAMMRIGYIKGLQARYEEAAQWYAVAVRLQPQAVEPLVYLQYQFLMLQNWSQLESASRAALALDANHYTSRSRLGYALYSQQRYAEAAAEYSKVAVLYPLDLDIMVMRGWSYALSGRKALAQQAFQKALEISPDNTSAQEGITFLSRLR